MISARVTLALTKSVIDMSLIKEFNNLRQQMDRLFDDIVHEQPLGFTFSNLYKKGVSSHARTEISAN
jgi:hypothetical protein